MISPAAVAYDTHAIRCELAMETLRSTGEVRLQVTGWSMFPGVRPGETLTIKRAAVDDVAVGDIVLFRREGRFVVHRVVDRVIKINGRHLVTRGDAMAVADDPIGEKELLGKVTFILRDRKLIAPERTLGAGARMVSVLLQRSEIIARAVARMHALRQSSVAIPTSGTTGQKWSTL